MRKFENWLTGLPLATAALLLPLAALEPASLASAGASASGLASTACDDGSAHLAMGCASALL